MTLQQDSYNQRCFKYRWLSSLFFTELAEEQLSQYRSGEGRALFDQMKNYVPSSILEQLFSHIDAGSIREAQLNIASDYAYLFLGAGGSAAVPPYMSVFTSDACTTHQQAETEVASLMAEYGLGVAIHHHEPADHIAILLEFMAFLCTEQEGNEHTVSLARQKNILKHFLLNWIPEFAELCRKASPTGFYTALASMTRNFLEADLRSINEQLQHMNPITSNGGE